MHTLLTHDIPFTEKLIRTAIVYAFLLVGLRLAGKRELGQLNPFDLVVLLLLSNTVQNAIIGNDNSLVGGMIGGAVLVVLHWQVGREVLQHPRLGRVLAGGAGIVTCGGR